MSIKASFHRVLAVLLIFSITVQSAILVNDTFSDGNSQNQALPNSIRLYNGRAGTVRLDSPGSANFNVSLAGGSEGIWGFFTDGSPVALDVGDRLVARVDFSATITDATNNLTDIRFGVFDSLGTRNTANLTGGMNSSTFATDTGYATRFVPTPAGSSTPPFTLHRRNPTGAFTDPLSQLTSGTEYVDVAPVTGSVRNPVASGVPHTYTFTIERLSATETRLTAAITDSGTFNINATATETSATPHTTFDWFGFRIPTGRIADITITRWQAELIPAAPVITTQPTPADQTVSVGANVNYSVTATGSNLTYQWRKNGIAIDTTANPSAATANLQLLNVQTTDTGVYDVVVSNESGSVDSNDVNLTVTGGPVDPIPVIIDHPDDTTVVLNSPASLSVTATGNNLNYQWYKNGVIIPGANSSTLNFASAQLSDTGSYTVVVSNSGGAVTSNAAQLTVVSAMGATGLQPVNGASGVCTDTSLRITFDQVPVPGTSGTIRVYRENGTLYDTIDMSIDTVPGVNVPGNQSSRNIGGASINHNYYPILVNGNTASIVLHQALEYNQTYYVLMDAGPINDVNGAPFAGFTDPNAFRFTTKPAAPAPGTSQLAVSADGTGDFCTVQGAIDFVPANNPQRLTINVADGVYEEIVYVRSNKRMVTVVGQSRMNTIIRYANNENLNSGSLGRPTIGVDAPDFILETLTVHNSTTKINASGNTRQAEAYRGNNDRMLLDRVDLISFQDTLQIQAQGPQGGFVNESYIEGDVDFMWGQGPAYFRSSELKDVAPASRPQGYYTQVRNPSGRNGFVFVNSILSRGPDTPDSSAYFGRIDPDDFPFSQVLWIDSLIDSHIRPEGWLFNNPNLPATPANYPNIRYWEYNTRHLSTGLPVDVSMRHPLSRQMDATEAAFWRQPLNVLSNWVPALEGDVSPRGAQADGLFDVSDFIQIGRFAAGLDGPVPANEFQKADVSPVETKGDGSIDLFDFVLAGRVIAGVEEAKSAGGPTDPIAMAVARSGSKGGLQPAGVEKAKSTGGPTDPVTKTLARSGSKDVLQPAGARTMSVSSRDASRGNQVTIPIVVEAQGDENGFSFSLNYESTKLSNPVVQVGTDMAGAFLIPNTTQIGSVGVVIALPPQQTIAAGTRTIVTVRFDVAGDAPVGPSPITFSDSPTLRRTSNALAQPLATTYVNGEVNILAPTAAGVAISGRTLAANGRGISLVAVTLTAPSGESRTVLTNTFGHYRFEDVTAGATYIVSVRSARYRFSEPVRAVSVEDSIDGLNFVANR